MADIILNEGRFQFNFAECVAAFVADKPQYNGLSAVDFIIETKDRFLFVEVKDPDHPQAQKFDNVKTFMEELETPSKISGKFKDSLLKELAKGSVYSKPIVFVLVLECNAIDILQRRKIYTNLSCAIPQFKEDMFPCVKSVSFALFDVRSFQEAYPMFKVTHSA